MYIYINIHINIHITAWNTQFLLNICIFIYTHAHSLTHTRRLTHAHLGKQIHRFCFSHTHTQVSKLNKVRETRDDAAVAAALDALKEAALGECVAVVVQWWCSVLQCVVVCCSSDAVWRHVLQCVAACCSGVAVSCTFHYSLSRRGYCSGAAVVRQRWCSVL